MASPSLATISSRPTSLLNLPSEIWVQVLTYLPVEDRNNFRLTCRRFDDLANDVLLRRSDETVFYGNLNTVAAIKFLSNCKKAVWNLKFVQVSLKDESLDDVSPFFAKQGGHVRSLAFDDCTIGSKVLKDMISKCEYLHRFTYEVGQIPGLCIGRTLSYSSEYMCEAIEPIYDTFVALHAGGFVHQNVTEFTFRIHCRTIDRSPLTDESFRSFFAVFPSIKELDFQYCSSFSVEKETNFSLRRVYDQLFEMRHQLNRLSFDLCCADKVELDDPVKSQTLTDIMHIEMKNLKQRSLFWADFWDDSLMNSCLRLKHLTEFGLLIGEKITDCISTSNIIQIILNTATELRTLHLSSDLDTPDTILSKDCFQALVRSKLTTLSVTFDLEIDFKLASLDTSLQPNQVLNYLNVKIYPYSECLLFYKYFPRLEKLLVRKLEHGLLPDIFNHKTDLRYLIFVPNEIVQLHSNLSIQQRLTIEDQFDYKRRDSHLTHLQFVGGFMDEAPLLSFAEFILSKFKFPKLRSLTIIPCDLFDSLHRRSSPKALKFSSSIDDIFQTLEKLTELEYLEMHFGTEIPCHHLLSLCGSLPNLRYLIFFDSHYKPFEECQYHRFFQICPLLRFLVHCKSTLVFVKYFKDPVTNAVQNTTSSGSHCIKFYTEGIPQKYFIPVDHSSYLC